MNKQNSLNKITYIIFFIFIGYLGFIFYKLQYSAIDYFDKENKLSAYSINKIEKDIKSTLNINDYKNTIIHLKEENCKCNLYSNQHIKELNKKLNKDEFNIINVNIKKSELKKIIPAYPSTIIFDENGNLAYVGAYSDGLMCSSKNSIVEMVLTNIKAGFNPALINGDTKGCYCYN